MSVRLSDDEVAHTFAELRLRVLERGWLSSNNVVFDTWHAATAAVVDTGYVAHAAQTVSLVRSALGDQRLGRVVNTHLHSDHCGGNAALQGQWNGVQVFVPAACFQAALRWDQDALSFLATDQRCDRFSVAGSLQAGDRLQLGAAEWEVHAAPGHDPTAVMLYEPSRRVLVSGDALWEKRLAIIFPELVGEPGFDPCIKTLETIRSMEPSIVIPGHGRPFTDVDAALQASRERLESFMAAPDRHRRHAVRALVMFHMLELRVCSRKALVEWLCRTPITGGLTRGTAEAVVQSLTADGALMPNGNFLEIH
jgi:glyoxylase-like metal-dependent hydrolase (beta-lactamase superfamily II)